MRALFSGLAAASALSCILLEVGLKLHVKVVLPRARIRSLFILLLQKKYVQWTSYCFPVLFPMCRRIWHVDAGGRVSTPLNFTATVSYINFLNHSDQARVATGTEQSLTS